MSNKALIVVDYQVDFVSGALGFAGAELIEPLIAEKIKDCRKNGGTIIFTYDTHHANYLDTAEGKKLPVPHCIENTEGFELFGKIRGCLEDGDIVIRKPSFGSLELADILREKKFDEVELCGLVTDICVVSNAIITKAALPEAKVIVDGAACASFDKSAHKAALQVMKSVQIDVIND